MTAAFRTIKDYSQTMKLSQHVLCAIDDAVAGKLDAALLHACIAIDATSKRMYPSERKVGIRYVNCLRSYYWLLEPAMGAGFDLVETRFSNITLGKNKQPDFAEVVYEVFRCSHAHGDEVPSAYSVTRSEGGFYSEWLLAHGELHMPDRVIWALLSAAVFSKANRNEKTTGDYSLSLGNERFLICESWGKEDKFRLVAARYNQMRVKFDGLERLQKHEGGEDSEAVVNIINPPFL